MNRGASCFIYRRTAARTQQDRGEKAAPLDSSHRDNSSCSPGKAHGAERGRHAGVRGAPIGCETRLPQRQPRAAGTGPAPGPLPARTGGRGGAARHERGNAGPPPPLEAALSPPPGGAGPPHGARPGHDFPARGRQRRRSPGPRDRAAALLFLTCRGEAAPGGSAGAAPGCGRLGPPAPRRALRPAAARRLPAAGRPSGRWGSRRRAARPPSSARGGAPGPASPSPGAPRPARPREERSRGRQWRRGGSAGNGSGGAVRDGAAAANSGAEAGRHAAAFVGK